MLVYKSKRTDFTCLSWIAAAVLLCAAAKYQVDYSKTFVQCDCEYTPEYVEGVLVAKLVCCDVTIYEIYTCDDYGSDENEAKCIAQYAKQYTRYISSYGSYNPVSNGALFAFVTAVIIVIANIMRVTRLQIVTKLD
jgi:hypothetical protein